MAIQETLGSRREDVRNLVQSWPTQHPDRRLTVRTIERELRMKNGTASKLLDELREQDPNFSDPRRRSDHNLFYSTPSGFTSVGRILREVHTRLLPNEAADALGQAGIHVERLTQRKSGKVVHRFLLEDSDAVRATAFLEGYRPLPKRRLGGR